MRWREDLDGGKSGVDREEEWGRGKGRWRREGC